ncbi:MAG: hypothetical protein QGH42_02815 [Kiritimatiellia bacterium]|jgi:hypothetical protein|nr:hypothetical protein [Kiritimatiellia bacterium]MDP6809139.1 hypothetical protein [Kiritimatiellia bacterium]MDP7023169.1 hypothetical protein [Kiritimatiellia bacterium]
MAFLKLDRLGARERWGLGVALVFVLVLMVDRLVVGMVADRVSAVEAQTASDSKELDYNRGVLRSKGPTEAEYVRIEGMLASEMSDSEAIDVIKGEIDDLARETGVDLVSMEHRSPEPSAGYTEYVIEIRKLEASMEGLLSFLHRIWEAPGMMRVRKVMIGPGAEDGRVEGTVVVSKILIPTGAVSEGEEPEAQEE